MKKILSIIIVFSVLLSALTVGIHAINLQMTTTMVTIDGRNLCIVNSKLEDAISIDSATAGYIAEFFIDDMIVTDMCSWDDQTDIVDVITMYNDTGTSPTAYTVELTEGYVVVSAFADASSLIPEWSDCGEPVYSNLFDDSDTIVYLGAYQYFSDSNTSTVIDLNGNTVMKSDLINFVEESRDINNLSVQLLNSCVISPDVMVLNDVNELPIEDPYAHARAIYGEEFNPYGWHNEWENYFNTANNTCYYSNDFVLYNGYEGACVPICITNIVLAHMRKYGLDFADYNLNINNENQLFNYVVSVGEANGWYDRNEGGVYTLDIPDYCLTVLNSLSIGTNVVGHYVPAFDRIQYDINNGDLLCLSLFNHPVYHDDDPQTTDEAHLVLCYAYVRIRGTVSGNFKTYLKVADGWYPTPRFIDLSEVVSYINGNYVYNGNCSYVRVELWR